MTGILGEIKVSLTSSDLNKSAQEIKNICKVKLLYKDGNSLIIALNPHNFKKIKGYFEENKLEYEVLSVKGLYFIFKKYIKRIGLYVGTILGIFLITFLSNVALRFEFNDDIDADLKEEIIEIIGEKGISLGKSIQNMNFDSASSAIARACPEISFASIAHNNSVIIIDVSFFSEKENSENRRIPSNIVASKDGIITSTVVRSGNLEVLIGDAVNKGDVLVSGIDELRNGRVYYNHSSADIFAKYAKKLRFYVPYSGERKKVEKIYYNLSLRLFDAKLPFVKYSGLEEISSKPYDLKLFGVTLPIGFSVDKYCDYRYIPTEISTEEAIKILNNIANNYEKYILKDEIIEDSKYEIIYLNEGVILEADYELVGSICEQQYIFAK